MKAYSYLLLLALLAGRCATSLAEEVLDDAQATSTGAVDDLHVDPDTDALLEAAAAAAQEAADYLEQAAEAAKGDAAPATAVGGHEDGEKSVSGGDGRAPGQEAAAEAAAAAADVPGGDLTASGDASGAEKLSSATDTLADAVHDRADAVKDTLQIAHEKGREATARVFATAEDAFADAVQTAKDMVEDMGDLSAEDALLAAAEVGESMADGDQEIRDGFVDGWRRRLDALGGDDGAQALKRAMRTYDSLLREHFLKMSFAQATALGAVGDVIAQRLERRWNPGQPFELKRTAHAGVLNMIIDGVFTPQWYNVVDYVNDDMTFRAALVKALAASAIYGPFANGMFLAGARLLRYGPAAPFDWAEWRRQLLVCTVRDFEMWPPLHILNFWLVPKHWRPLAGHLAGVAMLGVISSTGLTDAGLPLGQRSLPLALRWARGAANAVGGRMTRKGRRAAGAPVAGA